ncbi:MAG TPA: O-antigen ligase family protein [Terriglobia bacterium]|nr:O-antigen ligase family protein [Terriglobia bacterium]
MLGSLCIAVGSQFINHFVLRHRHYYIHDPNLYLLAACLIAPVVVVFFGAAFLQAAKAGLGVLPKLKWYHALWALIFVSGLILRKRAAGEATSAPVDSAAAFRVGVVTLVGVFLLVRLFLRRTEWLQSLTKGLVGVLTWFTLTAMVSSLWSVYWQWTLYKSCEYAVDVGLLAACVLVIVDEAQMKTLFDWTWIWYGLLLLSVWAGVLYSPDQALSKTFEAGESGIGLIGVQLVGVFPDLAANAVGEFSAVLGAVALARLLPIDRRGRYERIWYSWLLLAAFTTMFLAQTRSALAGFCVAVFLIFLFSRRVLHGATIVISSAVLIIVTGVGELIMEYLERGQSQGQMLSLSSRLSWWSVAFSKFMDYPLTGLGMWAAGRFGVLAKLGLKMTATMHSDWIEILVGMSFWGIIPVLTLITWAWVILIRAVLRSRQDPSQNRLSLEAVGVFGVLTVRMVFMTDLTLHPPLHFFAILAYAEWLRRRSNAAYLLSRRPPVTP